MLYIGLHALYKCTGSLTWPQLARPQALVVWGPAPFAFPVNAKGAGPQTKALAGS